MQSILDIAVAKYEKNNKKNNNKKQTKKLLFHENSSPAYCMLTVGSIYTMFINKVVLL